MNKDHSLIVKYAIVLCTTLVLGGSVCAYPPSKTIGVNTHHAGKNHHAKGGMPSHFMANIHALFGNHKNLTREVELTKTGYRATTTSEDPKIVSTLQEHVKQMQSRLEEGKSVRRWDPAYAEMMDHYADLEVKITPLENGIQAEMIGKTKDAVKIAQNHASVLNKFVDNGDVEMHKSHPGVLTGSAVAKSAAKGKGGCGGGKCCKEGKGKNGYCAKPAGQTGKKK